MESNFIHSFISSINVGDKSIQKISQLLKLVRRAYFLFFILALISFFSIKVPPTLLGPFSLMAFAILPALIINLGFLIYFVIRKHYKWVFISLLLFGFGYQHIGKTLNFNSEQTQGELKVLNSNVRIFNVYKHLRDKNRTSSKEMINWIANNDADILILQEYYNQDTSKIWATRTKIGTQFKYHFLQVSLYNRANSEFGQIIFSKYPIINKGVIEYENRTFNQAIFADIVKGKDTIRVYNIHLQSMAIEERKLFDGKNDENHIKQKVKDTSHKLMRGFRLRTKQIEKIIAHIRSSPYPVILGADMNDIPYSYSYDQFSKLLNNSFEEKGNGFGFTFNGKLFFLRIDNLFTSSDFETNSFNVHREIPYSDHFPVSGTYTLKK